MFSSFTIQWPVHISLLFFQSINLLFQPPKEEDRDGAQDDKTVGRRKEQSWVLGEGEAVFRPVGEVGGGVNCAKPDDQANQGGGVQSQPADGDSLHLGIVLASICKRTFR